MHHAFYAEGLSEVAAHDVIALPDAEAHHVIKVLRGKTGDALALVDGKGYMANGSIAQLDKRRCSVEVEEIINEKAPSPALSMAIAPTKNNDRLEWFLEKATEIGVSEIIPILTQNAERKVIKEERLQKILVSAMKQSQRLWLPVLHPLTPLADVLEKNASQKLIAHCEEGSKTILEKALNPTKDALILIGPEGDFSSSEIGSAVANGWQAISMGEARLRTETAALSAVQIFQSMQRISL